MIKGNDMNYRRKLFSYPRPYDLDGTKKYFFKAVYESILHHEKSCPEYAEILKMNNFSLSDLKTEDDLYKIPPITTLYLKRNRMLSVSENKLAIKATSSGTKGMQSFIGLDKSSLLYGIIMMLRFFSYHKVLSLIPVNYIVLGYEPSSHNNIGAIKTAYGTTKFAPALHREYALKDTGAGYEINIDGIKKALKRYSRMPFPVRFVGFPAYMYFLAQSLKENNIHLKLSKKSKILLGGGWKQFTNEQIDADSFYKLIKETLGIEKKNCLEFFSAVEHPLPYCKCDNGNFHVPVYSRAIIRDINNFSPLDFGEIGLLSFISPLVTSVPITSIMTDDMAVMHHANECNCGIGTPFFELKGRAGVQQIKTCTTDAASLLNDN